MAFAVNIYFENHVEEQIKNIWDAFNAANLSNRSQRSFRPHITLSIYEKINCADCECKINQISSQFNLPYISFDHLGIFSGNEKVLFLAPTPNKSLLAMQKDVFDALSPYATNHWKLYEPGSWVPHCTLANDLNEEELFKAIELSMAIQLPIQTKISQIGIIEFDPILPIFQINIKK